MAFGLEEFAERLPDTAAILSHASTVHRVANRTDTAMEGIEQTWLRLSQPGIYSVPGDEVVFTALQPARTETVNLVETATELSNAMASYADEIDSLKAWYADLKARVDSFDAEHPWAEKADWNDDDEAVAEHNVLASESARLLADLDQAQRDAANRVAAISGSGRRYSEGGDGEEIEYGRSAEDRVADAGGHMKDGDFWLVDWWEFTGRNREIAREANNKVREGTWEIVKDGFIPGLPPFGRKRRKTAPGGRSKPLDIGGKGKPFPETYSPDSGRNPAIQPRVGDTDDGNGYFKDWGRNMHGAPEQQYFSGIDRVDSGHAREYVLMDEYGNEVPFDGHGWIGDPPKEYFPEIKGHYNWMWPELKLAEFNRWSRELTDQHLALAHAGTHGYVHEMIFTEKSVMDEFMAFLPAEHPARANLVFTFKPMP